MLLSSQEQEDYANDNMLLVYHVAGKFQNSGLDRDDLIGIGSIGMTKALQSFSTERGVKFSTYAYNCIRNEILHYLRRENRYRQNTVLGGTVLYTDSEGHRLTIEDTLGTKSSLVIDSISYNSDMDILDEALASLGRQEQFVLIHRHGLKGAKFMTQSEIAKEIGMSQPYVCRLERDLEERLKEILRDILTLEDSEYYESNNTDYINKSRYAEYPYSISE